MPKKTTDQKIDELALAIGRGLNELRQDVHNGFVAVDSRLDGIDQRLDRIEFLISGQDRRISILEDRMRQVSEKLGLSLNQ